MRNIEYKITIRQDESHWEATLADNSIIGGWYPVMIRYGVTQEEATTKLIQSVQEEGFQKGKDFAKDMAYNGWIPNAVQDERQRIAKDLLGAAEPYEDSKWLNTLSREQITKIIFPEE